MKKQNLNNLGWTSRKPVTYYEVEIGMEKLEARNKHFKNHCNDPEFMAKRKVDC